MAQESSADAMNIKYDLNTDDVVEFALYNYEHSPQTGRARRMMRLGLLVMSFVFLICALVMLAVAGMEFMFSAILLGIMAIFIFCWSLFSSMFVKRIIKKAVSREYGQKQNSFVGTHSLSISPEVISDTSDNGNSSIKWNTVDYIAATDKYLFITARASRPYIVPERAFKNNSAFQQFVQMVQSYHQAAEATQKI